MISNVVGGPIDGELMMGPDDGSGLVKIRFDEIHIYAWDYATATWGYEFYDLMPSG